MIPVPVISLPIMPEPNIDVDVPPPPATFTLPDQITIRIDQPRIPFINTADVRKTHRPLAWDDYVGQGPAKEKLRVHIDAALNNCEPLPHTALLSRMPGTGKSTLAEIVAAELGTSLFKMEPPFDRDTLIEAAIRCGDHDVLFIDEIHKMADNGPAMAETLLPIMEDGVVYIDGAAHHLNEFTIIGATTDAGKLPNALLSRFVIVPYFQRYTIPELIKITKTNFADRAGVRLTSEVLVAIAKACRGNPREARKLVADAKALQDARQRFCTASELLSFTEVEPDGTTRRHIAYLTALYQFFGREVGTGDDRSWEYIAGEASLMNIVDEDKVGLARLERFLIERGLVDRTPRGRRLTARGIAKAVRYVNAGNKLATG